MRALVGSRREKGKMSISNVVMERRWGKDDLERSIWNVVS